MPTRRFSRFDRSVASVDMSSLRAGRFGAADVRQLVLAVLMKADGHPFGPVVRADWAASARGCKGMCGESRRHGRFPDPGILLCALSHGALYNQEVKGDCRAWIGREPGRNAGQQRTVTDGNAQPGHTSREDEYNLLDAYGIQPRSGSTDSADSADTAVLLARQRPPDICCS